MRKQTNQKTPLSLNLVFQSKLLDALYGNQKKTQIKFPALKKSPKILQIKGQTNVIRSRSMPRIQKSQDPRLKKHQDIYIESLKKKLLKLDLPKKQNQEIRSSYNPSKIKFAKETSIRISQR